MTSIKLEPKKTAMQTEAYWENLVKRSLCRFLLLAQLAKGPVHGYGINQAIKEACQGCCEPTEAMVYSTMKELQDGGYVDCRMEEHQGRQRRVCWLTVKMMTDEGKRLSGPPPESGSGWYPPLRTASNKPFQQANR